MSLGLKMKKKMPVPKDQAMLTGVRDRMSDGARLAAERVGPAARQARTTAGCRVTDARQWAAPRLESASHFVEDDLGPRVSSVLNRTARKVEPAKPRHRRRNMAIIALASGALLSGIGILAARRSAENAEAGTDDEKGDAPAETWESSVEETTEVSADGQVHVS